MAVGKGSMARASKAAAGKKSVIAKTEETVVLEVTAEAAEKTEEKAVQPDAEAEKPKKKRTYTRRKKAEQVEIKETPKMEESENTEAAFATEKETKTNTGRIAVGEEMPIYYY